MLIVSHTDPISFNPGSEEYSYHEGLGPDGLEIHFESDETREIYRNIAVEPSTSDLDNPSEVWFDEG